MIPINLSVLEALLVLIAGTLMGLLFGWLLAKYRLTPSLVKSKTEADAHLETLQNKKEEIEDVKAQAAAFQAEIKLLTNQLLERLSTMGQHINNLGRDIERSTHTYNKIVGSLERRVLSSARKFKDLGITQKNQNKTLTVTHIDSNTRTLRMEDS